jgi:hypothetical protein
MFIYLAGFEPAIPVLERLNILRNLVPVSDLHTSIILAIYLTKPTDLSVRRTRDKGLFTGAACAHATSIPAVMFMSYTVIILAVHPEASGVPQLFLGDDSSDTDCTETHQNLFVHL